MANKQSDPVYILAETIIDSVQQIATSKTDKAAYDKTYSAIILGTNQKFTDDVSEQDKTAIIEKFSIPEAVEEGEQTYYTFKINGAYYCVRQNGNFKLYDNIMVYIPNGDWSNMYFDYPDASSHGGGGGGSGEEHQLIVSVEAPGGADPKLGDMWLFVNDKSKTIFDELTPDNYVGMYTWQEDEDTGVQSWKSANCTVGGDIPPSSGVVGDLWIKLEDDLFSEIYLCTSTIGSTVWSEVYPNNETGEEYNLYISADKPLSADDIWISIDDEETRKILGLYQYKYNASTNSFEWVLGGINDGVGENVGQHNERFNGYTAADGCTITGGDYNHAEGYKNSLVNCKYTHVGGKENSVTDAECSMVTGEENTVTRGATTSFLWNILCGNNIEVHGANRSIIAGSGHVIADLVGSIVTGIEHIVVNNNVYQGIVLGVGANTAQLPASGNAYTIVAGGAWLGNVFVVDAAGNVYCRTVTQSNADYAELFEWADGNPDNEDRRGMLVALDGDKIVPADGYDIFGIVSANPAVICNSPQIWQGKFKRDVFGCTIRDKDGEPVLNPAYDPEKKYIPREQRPEWAAIGIVGRLIVRDNGSCKAGEWVVGNNGYAFPSLVGKTNVRCLKRIDDMHVEVFIK